MYLVPSFLTLLTGAIAVDISTVYQFPSGTWLENIALLRNSSLLVTVIGRAEVHMVHPTSPATSSLVASFPHHNSVLGITELSQDKFAVAVGNMTPSNTPVANTSSIFTIDFSTCNTNTNSHTSTPRIQHMANLPDIGLINGITSLNTHTLLLTDSWLGNIVSLNVQTAQYKVALSHPTLESDMNKPLPLGVNGIRFHNVSNYLYYTNTAQSLVGKVKLNAQTAEAAGDYEIIAQGEHVSQPDDFAVALDGTVYLARPLGDELVRVGVHGHVEILAKGGFASGATSVVFAGGETLFVSESGLEGGVVRYGGRVVRVEL